MKRPWTRAEKWLFATPLLFGLAAVVLTIGPRLVHQWRGYPTEIALVPGGLNSHIAMLTPIALSRDGQVLVVGWAGRMGADAELGLVLRWDARTLKPLPPLGPPKPTSSDGATGQFVFLSSVSLSNDGRMLACSSNLQRIALFDLTTRRKLWSVKDEGGLPAFSPDSKWLAFNSARGEVRVVQARTGKSVASWKLTPPLGKGALRFSPDGLYLAAKGPGLSNRITDKLRDDDPPIDRGGHIELRRTTDWKVERVLPLTSTSRMAFSPDGSSLIGLGLWFDSQGVGYGDTLIRCFDVGTGKVKWEIDSRKPKGDQRFRLSHQIAYSPDGTTLAVAVWGSSLAVILLLDVQTGEVKRTLQAQKPLRDFTFIPEGLAFSTDSKRLFARDNDKIQVWDLE